MKCLTKMLVALCLASVSATASAQPATAYQGTSEKIDLATHIIGSWHSEAAGGRQVFVFKTDGTWALTSIVEGAKEDITLNGIYEVKRIDANLNALNMALILGGDPVDVSDTVIIMPNGDMQSVENGGVYQRGE